MSDLDTPYLVQRSLRWLVRATIVLYVALLLVGYAAWHDSQRKSDQIAGLATTSNSALCALRGDLESRVTASEQFLINHPEGFAGISPASIRTSIDGQRRTIVVLAQLKCSS